MNQNKYECVKDDFRILSETKKLLTYVDSYICENFPKNKKHLKVLLFDECKSLYMSIVRANITSGNIRSKHQVDALCSISFIDYIIGYLYDLKIIINRRYSSATRILSNLELMIRKWMV